MTDLAVRELKQADWDQWDQWLTSQPWGSPFSSAWWLEATCRAFGGRPLLLGVFRGDRLAGGVALRIADMAFFHVVRPSMLYNPVVLGAASPRAGQEVLAALLEDIARRDLIVRPLTCTADAVDLREAVWHHWTLTASWTVLTPLRSWVAERDVSRDERTRLAKAERNGLEATLGVPDVDILYDMMRSTILRHGHDSSLTRDQLRILVEGSGSHGLQVVTRGPDGTPLSASLVMMQGPRVAFAAMAGSSTTGIKEGAAVVRDMTRLRELAARGYEYLDWCGANQPGIAEYKLNFGGTLTTRLAISREPLWVRAAVPVHAGLARIAGAMRRRRLP